VVTKSWETLGGSVAPLQNVKTKILDLQNKLVSDLDALVGDTVGSRVAEMQSAGKNLGAPPGAT
jgi:hypothetical protein